MALLPLSLLLLCTATHAASRYHSAPDDPYTFPKYRVAFLNGLPLLNDTAQRWLNDGLLGGELEFMEQPWDVDESLASSRHAQKSISGSDEAQSPLSTPADSVPPQYQLEQMKMGPEKTYLCLIPPPLEEAPPPEEDSREPDPDPYHSWTLLNPLAGSCIYHRQGWWTYSYCHNDHVRQFRELAHSQPGLPPGQVEEDTVFEAFTLGRSPPLPEPGTELTTAQQAVVEKNIELGHASSHYLVQRWSDGTVCDKTGYRRQIEVQFHCSTTTTDSILFIKETKTCHYIMVIHTPRLCGEHGFRTRLEQGEEAVIRCRQVVASSTDAMTNPDAGESRHPYSRIGRPPKLPAAPAVIPPAAGPGVDGAKDKRGGVKVGGRSMESIANTIAKVLFGNRQGQGGQGDQGQGGQVQEDYPGQLGDEVRGLFGLDDDVLLDGADAGGLAFQIMVPDGASGDKWREMTDEEIEQLIRDAVTNGDAVELDFDDLLAQMGGGGGGGGDEEWYYDDEGEWGQQQRDDDAAQTQDSEPPRQQQQQQRRKKDFRKFHVEL